MVAKINRIIRVFIWRNLCAITFWLCVFTPSESSGLTLISDAETQNYLQQVVKPLFNAGNVSFNPQKILILNDLSLNAFVSDGNYLFVNSGTLIASDDSNELSGILAHETGHILGGHIARMKLKMENMQYIMLGSMLMAGATAASTGNGNAIMAVILGAQSSALNSMLNHRMQEERSADESAIKILAKTKQSTKGLRRFMTKIKRQNTLNGIAEDMYFRTHPLTNERIAHFDEATKNNNFPTNSPLDKQFSLVRAKLSAFLEDTDKVWRKYPKSDSSAPARYAHAILYFREANLKLALSNIDDLINQYPKNPYFWELKGQFLFESGNIAESVTAYRSALNLLPNSSLIKLSLAHSIIESSQSDIEFNEAISLLNQAQISFPSAFGWQLLSQAYAKIGDMSASFYAVAEFNYAIGNRNGALKSLERANKSANISSAVKLKISDLSQRLNSNN